LRIVLATYALNGPGGSESYALTVAHELRRLGHEVTLTANDLGRIAELAERDGLLVARHPSELPAECDALLVQDRVVTAELVARYPDARVVHVSHSDLFDHQLPMLVPGTVDAVVVLSHRQEIRVQALALDVPVVRLRQPISTDRFAPAGALPERPHRALLLGNYLDGDRRAALVDSWQDRGVECVQVGTPTHTELEVLPAIASADIVVAKARAALEAMSCARAVYVYDAFGGDGWVTAENYAILEADGFAGLATSPPRSRAQLAADLEDYDAGMGQINNELVRTHHSARRHTAQLLDVLHSPERSQRPGVEALHEVSRLARLLMHAEGRALTLWHDYVVAQGQARAEVELWRERARQAERRLDRAEALLATKRAQVGLSAGRVLDRVRRRG
jgi:hypothetical protein